MLRSLLHIRLSTYFFGLGAALVFMLAFGFVYPVLLLIAKVLCLLLLACLLADGIMLLPENKKLRARRIHPRVLGIGDRTKIELELYYGGRRSLKAEWIEELPEELQERNFLREVEISPGTNLYSYEVFPVNRGVYRFGKSHFYVEGLLGLLRLHCALPTDVDIPVYPSIRQMRDAAILAFRRNTQQGGSKRLQRLGKSYEFDQITPFVEGDDFRNVNWKATGKTRELMVNQYEDERSQNLYCVVSKGRSMNLSFKGLSLLDYAINSTLALSNAALRKYDKVGLISFSDKVGTALRAENRRGQLNKILESLYRERERDCEPSYELLYRSVDKLAKNRSLIVLFCHFETPYMLERVLHLLVKINRKHLLLMVLFKDEELEAAAGNTGGSIEQVYRNTLAQKYLRQRQEISDLLLKRGIHTISSYPEKLSIDTLNAYLSFKSRGLI